MSIASKVTNIAQTKDIGVKPTQVEMPTSLCGHRRCNPQQTSRRQNWRACSIALPTTKPGMVPIAMAEPHISPPVIDYLAKLREREKDPTAPPLLLLAPMENLADAPFRVSHARMLGGFDEACIEFMRVPDNANKPAAVVRGVCAPYNAWELHSQNTPLGAQLMGSNPELLGLAAQHLALVKRAPRVDLNCGCPANTVTGNGAGSSLLRTPDRLYKCAKAMVDAAGGHTVVTVKMRAGFDDTSLFEENLLAAQEAGAAFITLHARTKKQTYDGHADWSLIARARQLLRIPVIGNGDVVSVAAARQLLQEANCQGIMIGRGAVQDPLLFLRIKASFLTPELPWTFDEPASVQGFLRVYANEAFKPHPRGRSHSPQPAQEPQEQQQHADSHRTTTISSPHHHPRGPDHVTTRGKFGRIKKVMKYLFNSSPELAVSCQELLRVQPGTGITPEEFVDMCCDKIRQHWPAAGPSRLALYNHMKKTTTVLVDSCV